MAGAIGVGYLLGRTRKARLALALGMAAATGQLERAPGMIADRTQGLDWKKSPLGKAIAEPSERLLEAGKAAAIATLSSRIESVATRLEERAASAAGALEAPEGDEETSSTPQQQEDKSTSSTGETDAGSKPDSDKADEQGRRSPDASKDQPDEDAAEDASEEETPAEEPKQKDEESKQKDQKQRDQKHEDSQRNEGRHDQREPAMAGPVRRSGK